METLPSVVSLKDSLSLMSDPGYAEFMRKLVPSIEPSTVLGVRMPALRKFAKEFSRTPGAGPFLQALPHGTYEENCLHGILVSRMRDFDRTVSELDRFLPYVDNWAVCDLISPDAFRGVPDGLEEKALAWARSERVYTARFGIGVLMRHFLEDSFDRSHLCVVASLASDEYYLNMMRAWYLATALAIRPDDILPVLEKGNLDEWTRRKAIQKALESRRIPEELRPRLRALRG